ncbi:hypothetical protein JKP88DRAFT_353389 [Tribonema minus]|uniref:S1 motif domain-containing protein n=1 Tax=Tribonema minus TaxID=303371 RepID=A0A835ZGC1_9STRA|nr:hypothetical protein JKP88DRAFT_353389 [Tribonema minus]
MQQQAAMTAMEAELPQGDGARTGHGSKASAQLAAGTLAGGMAGYSQSSLVSLAEEQRPQPSTEPAAGGDNGNVQARAVDGGAGAKEALTVHDAGGCSDRTGDDCSIHSLAVDADGDTESGALLVDSGGEHEADNDAGDACNDCNDCLGSINTTYNCGNSGEHGPLIMLHTLETGQKLSGTVVGMLPHAAFVSCGVGREIAAEDAEQSQAPGAKVKVVNGYLRQADLVEGVALETQLVKQAGTQRVIRVGQEVEAYVKKAWPSEGRFCLTLDPCVTPESVAARAREAQKARQRYKQSRAAPGDLEPGKERQGTVTRVYPYGLMLEIGAKRPALLHVSKIAEATGTKLKLGDDNDFAAVGDKFVVTIISNTDGRIELGYVRKVEPALQVNAGAAASRAQEMHAAAATASAVVGTVASNGAAASTTDDEYPQDADEDDDEYQDEVDEDDEGDGEFDPDEIDYSLFDDY